MIAVADPEGDGRALGDPVGKTVHGYVHTGGLVTAERRRGQLGSTMIDLQGKAV